MKDTQDVWPVIGEAYLDEFGEVSPEIYQAGAELWPQALRLAEQTIRDAAEGQRLLLKACAAVTRRAEAGSIANLSAYLFQTYKRLLLAELEKLNGHRRKVESFGDERLALIGRAGEELDRRILLAQVVRRMTPEMRGVFELLCLGHTFEEIGRALGRHPVALGNAYRAHVKQIVKEVSQEDES